MIPYDIDPTLHSDQPSAQVLDDGYSPPAGPHDAFGARDSADHNEQAARGACSAIGEKSLF